MALQQFVDQVKSKYDASAEVGVSTSEDVPSAQAVSPVTHQTNELRSKTEASAQEQEVRSKLPGAAPKLGAEDCDTLSALAAVQIKYGRPAEAIPYLMMLRRNDPDNAEVARLLALALMKMGRWEQAEVILDELNGVVDPSTKPLLVLYRSIAAFKQRKLDIARTWLQRFRDYVAGGAV